jgi:IPT/TIG domain
MLGFSVIVNIVIALIVGRPVLASEAPVPTIAAARATVTPERASKGDAVVITLKDINQSEIKALRIGSIDVDFKTAPDGKLAFIVPILGAAGSRRIDVIGKDGKTVVATGDFTYIDDLSEAPSILGVPSSIIVILIYVVLIVSLPWAATIIDLTRAYREQRALRSEIISKLPSNISLEQLRALLAEMSQGPSGTTGLTRGAVALTLLLILGIAVFHIVVFAPKVPDMVEKLLTLLAGAFTSITGFYFGTRAMSESGQSQTRVSPPTGAAGAPPAITGVKPPSGAPGDDVTLTGSALGTSGTVLFDKASAKIKTWTDTSITVTVPVLGPGPVKITVTPTVGNQLLADFTLNPHIAGAPEKAAPGSTITLRGEFGKEPGTVSFGALNVDPQAMKWNENAIDVTVPKTAQGKTQVTVKSKAGAASKPVEVEVT